MWKMVTSFSLSVRMSPANVDGDDTFQSVRQTYVDGDNVFQSVVQAESGQCRGDVVFQSVRQANVVAMTCFRVCIRLMWR